MPTAKKAKAPKYCVHKPSGRAYVRIRGQFHYIGEHGTRESLEAYGRIVVELAAQPDVSAAVRTASTGLTVVELADAYWRVSARATTARRTARPAAGSIISSLSSTSIYLSCTAALPPRTSGPRLSRPSGSRLSMQGIRVPT